MKEKIKYLVFGVVLALTFSLLILPTLADMVEKQITVSTGISIYMNDIRLKPVDASGKPVEALIYNGTTYLPVRAVADAVGKAVMWNGKTRSVYLGKHDTDVPTVLLHELDYFDKSGSFKSYIDVKDNLGNIYDNGISGISYSSQWQTYFINGKYRKMKGSFILAYGARSTTYENKFKVYGDGKLIFNSPVMTGGVHPANFEIDLTGVLELKIEIYNDDAYLANTGLYQ